MEFNKALITNIKEMATAKQRTLLETKFLVDPTYMKIAFRDLYPEDNMGNTASNTGNTSTPQGYDLSLAR
jgi:glucose-6-phosphate isomerase